MTFVILDIGSVCVLPYLIVADDETGDYLRNWKYPTDCHGNICSFSSILIFKPAGGRQANSGVCGDEEKKIAKFY